ncbi:hypothetical protein ACYSNX_11155 [Myroides sp. LJL115]
MAPYLKALRIYPYFVLNQEATNEANELLNRVLTNLHITIEGKQTGKLSDVTRDFQMFNNIEYLKNKYPQGKMILFDSINHFIKSPNIYPFPVGNL